jgi:hypothetical protein
MINQYIEFYKDCFNEEPNIDDELKIKLTNSEWDEALKYSYKTDNVKIFKLIYLLTKSKFPIDYIVEMEKEIGEKCGKVCKPVWGPKGLELEILSYNVSDEIREKYGKKMDMISFVVRCRGYSMHIFLNNKFYYYFKLDKYGDRIKDIIREMC